MSNILEKPGPLSMGILNVTPDSFSDGGRYLSTRDAVARGLEMIEEGADIIDIGGESTRPGSERVDAVEQKRRILDVISSLSKEIPNNVLISVDTTLSDVAEAALDAGAGFVNDVTGGGFHRFDGKLLIANEADSYPIFTCIYVSKLKTAVRLRYQTINLLLPSWCQ